MGAESDKSGAFRRGAVPVAHRARSQLKASVLVLVALVLSGCDQLGIESPQKTSERLSADAKAIGGACRNALRAIEDCYVLNPKADKASVFQGWREMDEYMRENKLEGVVPVVPRPLSAAASKAAAAALAASAGGDEDVADAPVSNGHGKAKGPPKH